MTQPEDAKDANHRAPKEGERTTPYGPPEATTEDLTGSAPRDLGQRYDLLGEVGRGGMGIVYRARDRETGDVLALKVLKPEIAGRAELIERFKAELLLARKITHKNVCRTYELLRFGDTVAIAMEYVEGESLRSILERFGGVPLRRGLEWVSQVCAGLAEAHVQGVVHRDLKPENILIDRRGQAKVMDFGIARSLEADATKTGTLIGTPAYMSPEQVEGKPADARSDIYALGLILYEMFAGRRTFEAETPVALALKQIQETPPPPREVEPHLPAFLDRAILKCLEKEPKKRFQSVAELEAALSKKPEVKPAAAPGEEAPLPLHLTRWQRSDWLLVVAALAGLVLFFPFFERTSLAPRSQVHFDRSVLRRIAQEYAQRLGAPLGTESRIGAEPSQDVYDYLAQQVGAAAAREVTNNPVTYWQWQVDWPQGGELGATQVNVNNEGSLTVFFRDFWAGSEGQQLSPDQARPLAEKVLRDFYGQDPALLTLEPRRSSSGTWAGRSIYRFTWAGPTDSHGLRGAYMVRLVGGEVGGLSHGHLLPSGFVWQRPLIWKPPIFFVLSLMLVLLGAFQRQRVELRARWRIILLALPLAFGAIVGWNMFANPDQGPRVVISAAIGVLFAALWFFGSAAVEWVVRKRLPAKLSTLVRVFDAPTASESCGLALMRGTLLGLGLLGAETFLVWLGTSYLGWRLDSEVHIWMQSQLVALAWPAGATVLIALVAALALAFVLAFFASLVAGFLPRSPVAVVLAAALTVASGAHVFFMGAVQPPLWQVLLLFFDCLVLVWAFYRFDLLTLFVAVFTFGFCWGNYSMLVMLRPTGAVGEWVAFAVWGAIVAAAALVALQSSLRTAYRRLAAVFE